MLNKKIHNAICKDVYESRKNEKNAFIRFIIKRSEYKTTNDYRSTDIKSVKSNCTSGGQFPFNPFS